MLKLAAGTDPVTAAKAVVESETAAEVGATLLDLFTASAMVQVYEALSAANKIMFEEMSLTQAASVTWALLKKAGK